MHRPFTSDRPDAALLEELGNRLARVRLRQDLGQAELAERAGVSRATVQRLEAGQSTQLTNLMRILRALDLVQNLELLVPSPELSPLEALDRRGGPRQRASAKRSEEDSDASSKSNQKPAEKESDESGSTWSWGDER